MKKIFTLFAVACLALSVSAQEKVMFDPAGAYGNGATLTSENTKLVLGNDRAKKNYDLKLSSVKAYCAELFGQTVMVENEEGVQEEKTRVAYVVGGNNPKDGELGDDDKSAGGSYSPEKMNLPNSGTYFMITPATGGHITAFIVLNADKAFFVVKSNGEALPQSAITIKADGETPTVVEQNADNTINEKTTGTVEFDVVGGETYYVFCNGSKLSFGGYVFESNGDVPGPGPDPTGNVDLMDRFTYTWNQAESFVRNGDGTITFNAVQWGGLAAWFADDNVPVDWSAYSKIVFEFAEPTTVNTQILVSKGDISAWGNVGITSLECSFEGKDLTQVEQVALQCSDATTLVITKIYLVPAGGSVEPQPDGDKESIIDKFTGCWGAEKGETVTHNADGSITFNSVEWGGASAWLAENDTPVDWSAYTKLVFVYGEATPCATQGFVQTTTENLTWWGNEGITTLECPFDGKDVSAVNQVALQAAAAATIIIKEIYLVKSTEGIEELVSIKNVFDPNAPVYNLAGVRVGSDYKGIVIQNGCKFIQK